MDPLHDLPAVSRRPHLHHCAPEDDPSGRPHDDAVGSRLPRGLRGLDGRRAVEAGRAPCPGCHQRPGIRGPQAQDPGRGLKQEETRARAGSDAPARASTAESEGGKSRFQSARAAAEKVPARLSAARSRHASVDASFELVDRDRRLAASVLAGGIAFRLFFWLLPVALILGGVLGFTSQGRAEALIDSFGLTASAAEAVGEAAQAAGRGRWVLLLVGVGALLWTSSR